VHIAAHILFIYYLGVPVLNSKYTAKTIAAFTHRKIKFVVNIFRLKRVQIALLIVESRVKVSRNNKIYV
jgi:hypothetical protein